MTSNQSSLTCAATCWGIAALAGVLTTGALMVMGGWTFLQGAFMGVLVFAIGGAILSWALCRPLPAPGAVTASGGAKPTASAASKTASAPAAASPAASASGPAVQASTELPGEQELADRKGSWTYGEGDSDTAPVPTAAGDDAAAEESAPETLTGPRDGGADDLKKLKGVGPKLEETLNGLGFYHFDQIATWTDAEVAWVDTRLKFKGRIERDGWIDQAKILASGGETEFSKRK
ncbi:MAG: hypothetical protein AAGA05_01855 [Pseudomonadota bacterium]